MESKITMGNDEFILYIRKNSNTCNIKNDRLGRIIWKWLRDRGASKIISDQPCLWGEKADNIDELGLPKTATQFSFDRSLLPDLYKYLDSFV